MIGNRKNKFRSIYWSVMKYGIVLSLLAFCVPLFSQSFQAKYEVIIDSSCGITFVDDHLILPSSIQLKSRGQAISFSAFDATLHKIYLPCDTARFGDTIAVSYRYLMSRSRLVSAFDTSLIKVEAYKYDVIYNLDAVNTKGVGLIQGEDLVYNGSFTRGFSVGNSQSLVLNSNFDMQMSGELGNGLKVVAAISDDNIPIQPEGNTQVLQEFDKVFIEVSKDKTSLVAGDFELRRPDSYFMNFQKKLKGININHDQYIGGGAEVNTKVNVASSRGKFARQTIPTKEGNQGPYRLVGNNNERFIIILSGQEKVYFNGELLRRGLEYDYVIDYNSAEIIFSPNRLIARETRIIIEFEYTDLNYFRTLYHLRNDVVGKNYKINVNFYTEQDSKNSTSQIELDSVDISTLEASGDSRTLAYRSGVRPLAERESVTAQITYELLTNPNFPQEPNSTYLKFSADETKSLYFASFSEVGVGKGSYEIDVSLGVNGRVYKYVGFGQGKYEPVIELVPPEKKQMATIGGTVNLGSTSKLSSEIAMSNIDMNRFSTLDDGNNAGFAGFLEFENITSVADSNRVTLINKAKIERTDKTFNPLNPYRTAEFIRDWNTDSISRIGETIIQMESVLKRQNQWSIGYRFSTYGIQGFYKGVRNQILGEYRIHGWDIKADLGVTSSKTLLKEIQFLRPNFNISRAFIKLDNASFGVALESERNTSNLIKSDSILAQSYAFNYTRYYFASNTTRPFFAKFSFNKRNDDFAKLGSLEKALDINEWELNLNWNKNAGNRFILSFKNRDYVVVDQILVPNERSKKTTLGSLDHVLTSFNQGVQLTTNYQLASGQEPKIEYIFQKVENNLGDYVYVGNVEDTIQNVTDFRYDPSNPYATYIRIALPNNEFITTNNLSFNHSFRIDPAKFWSLDSTDVKWKKMLSRFNNFLSIRINTKTQANGTDRPLNPFMEFGLDQLVTTNAAYVNNFYFNRGNPSFDVILISRYLNFKNNLLNGFEARATNEDELRIRKQIYQNTDFIMTSTLGLKTYDSQLFDDRDHRIKYAAINGEVSFRPSTSFRINTKYKYNNRKQLINQNEKANINEWSIAFNQRNSNKSALDLTFSFVDINYEGKANTPLEYDILDGLKNGKNILWNLLYTRRLNGVLDLTINYEGRKTGDLNPIHVGRAQIKATF
ncbi:MAG: hypothetical protein IPN72_01345 [Saprospiraceae bacterium]|nr:hypothetical protein [Saprospiraceae bacterium]